MPASQNAFRVGFVPGVTPDKWGRTWAERMPRRPLDLVPLGDGFVAVELEGRGHSTVTEHRRQGAVDRVLAFFRERLQTQNVS